jgi:hypothetical protein
VLVLALALWGCSAAPGCDRGDGGDPDPGPDPGSDDDSATDPGPDVHVTVSVTVTGDGSVVPSTPQTVLLGESLTFILEARIDGCVVDIGGDCVATPNQAMTEVVITPQTDCTMTVAFDCGPSALELRPEHLGCFVENHTQQFTATQVFDSGERVDITDLVLWNSSDDAIATIDASGLATAVLDHGIIDITAELSGNPSVVPAETTMTLVRVTTWHQSFLSNVATDYTTGRVYLDNVVYAPGILTWDWAPRDWKSNTDGVSGRLWAIWSTDGGLTYEATAWDWIGNDSSSKARAEGATHSMWMGTMLTTVSDQPGGTFSNGRERTNLFFSPGVE